MAFEKNAFQIEAVNENVIRSAPCPEYSDEDAQEGSEDNAQLTAQQVQTSLAPGKEDKDVKIIVRQQRLNFKSPIRAIHNEL